MSNGELKEALLAEATAVADKRITDPNDALETLVHRMRTENAATLVLHHGSCTPKSTKTGRRPTTPVSAPSRLAVSR